MLRISFLLPGQGAQPCGGYKVVYEYANRLAAEGCEVHIAYAGSLFWRKKSLYFKLTNVVRYLERWWKGYSCRRWFALDKRVKEHWCYSLCEQHVPQADIYVATSPYTAMYLKDYQTSAQKFYFIQDYENWGDVTDARLRETYHYPLRKIVISSWLEQIMQEEGANCELIPNGFDFDYFSISIPVEEKEKTRVVMLNHNMERKGCKYGFEALHIVKEHCPALVVDLFGVPAAPASLPDWMHYYQTPDKETHNLLYNRAAIYLAPSVIEGWGLTVGEAMMCGQAVVCTDNRGFREMAEHEVNALIVPIKDSQALADAIIRLMEDDELRCRIARAGHASIQRFTWDNSYAKLRELFGIERTTS